MDVTVKQIARAEIPALLELILELARFERLESEVEATVETLQDSFFGPQPAAGALLGRCNGELAGYAIYFFTFSSFVGRPGVWLEDVYVRPGFRQRGIGRRLVEAVAQVGVERNCGRYEWMVLNWNQKALNFYRDLGAQVKNEWVLHRLDHEGLRRLAADGAKTGHS